LLCAVIFFPGCNLRCPWCHNGELVLGTAANCVTLEEALAHVTKRKHIIGGVVLSGGEPSLFSGLGELISRIKAIGLKVKIDTNGLYPEVLEQLFAGETTRPDYIAMDLKTSPQRYGELLPQEGTPEKTASEKKEITHYAEKLIKSAALIRSSGIAHEFRSIALPAAPDGGKLFFSGQDRAALAELAGDSLWNTLPFVPGNCLDPRWNLAGGEKEP
jgi:pyruvate formate lyase activating enzyme